MVTRVTNVKNSEYDIYIGRGSKWGNPFKIGIDGTREEVIKKYEEYLIKNKELYDALDELDGKVLGCHCFPLGCHGDILIKHLNLKKLSKIV